MARKIDPSREILRYEDPDRINHWLVAILFFLAALSGLSMFHPLFSWLFAIFGGGPWTRILHPFFGVGMALCFLFMASRVWSHNHIEPRDRQWMRQWRDVLDNREEKLPPIGKYNAGQKMIFWTQVICMTILVVTGFLFWQPWFAPSVPITIVRLATLLHSFTAVVLIIALIVHIYAAIWVKGSLRAMTQGMVTKRWARRHHPAWYEEVTKER